jgi:hypothetical protein
VASGDGNFNLAAVLRGSRNFVTSGAGDRNSAVVTGDDNYNPGIFAGNGDDNTFW